MLLLKDLPEHFNENNLELYVDAVTDLEYEEEEYTYDVKQYEGDTVVLVTFNTEAGSLPLESLGIIYGVFYFRFR